MDIVHFQHVTQQGRAINCAGEGPGNPGDRCLPCPGNTGKPIEQMQPSALSLAFADWTGYCPDNFDEQRGAHAEPPRHDCRDRNCA